MEKKKDYSEIFYWYLWHLFSFCLIPFILFSDCIQFRKLHSRKANVSTSTYHYFYSLLFIIQATSNLKIYYSNLMSTLLHFATLKINLRHLTTTIHTFTMKKIVNNIPSYLISAFFGFPITNLLLGANKLNSCSANTCSKNVVCIHQLVRC